MIFYKFVIFSQEKKIEIFTSVFNKTPWPNLIGGYNFRVRVYDHHGGDFGNRHGTEQVAEIPQFDQQIGGRKRNARNGGNTLISLNSLPNYTSPSTGPHLLILPKHFCQQTSKYMSPLAIFIQINLASF